MQVNVVLSYLDDEGRPVWLYSHSENIARSGDLEQMTLTAAAELDLRIQEGSASMSKQAGEDLESFGKEDEE